MRPARSGLLTTRCRLRCRGSAVEPVGQSRGLTSQRLCQSQHGDDVPFGTHAVARRRARPALMAERWWAM